MKPNEQGSKVQVALIYLLSHLLLLSIHGITLFNICAAQTCCLDMLLIPISTPNHT